jgi:Holliday junction DNA helicase RuvA
MIDYIKGPITFINSQFVVLEAKGVGYQIHCGNPLQFQVDGDKERVIYTYQHVREDILALYGFATREERTLFEKLLHVSGIGPKGALAILAAGTPSQVIGAIQTDDVSFLTKFPGIGKKTAQRLILDLKDKLDDLAHRFALDPRYEGIDHIPTSSKKMNHKTDSVAIKETLEALVSLGYSDKELERIIPELKKQQEDHMTTDRYIKLALQLLMR